MVAIAMMVNDEGGADGDNDEDDDGGNYGTGFDGVGDDGGDVHDCDDNDNNFQIPRAHTRSSSLNGLITESQDAVDIALPAFFLLSIYLLISV